MYFQSLPKLIRKDKGGHFLIMTNLLARASVKPSLFNNSALFYTYDIQDGDTPEIIAYKYYGDVYRYWIVLFANQILDPQWQWPMSAKTFDRYIVEKYPNTDVYGTVYEYTKTITTTDLTTNIQTTNTVVISQQEFQQFQAITKTFTLPSGAQVAVSEVANTVSIYEWEVQQNEKNRSIKILNSSYMTEVEQQLKSLMS